MWVLLLIKTAEPVLPSSVQLLVKCALPQGRRWAGEKHRYWILGVSAFSTSAGPWPKMMSFKLSRLLVWSPMILSTSPFSCKQSFHDFVSLCHIKECVRKTYRCVLREVHGSRIAEQRHNWTSADDVLKWVRRCSVESVANSLLNLKILWAL